MIIEVSGKLYKSELRFGDDNFCHDCSFENDCPLQLLDVCEGTSIKRFVPHKVAGTDTVRTITVIEED